MEISNVIFLRAMYKTEHGKIAESAMLWHRWKVIVNMLSSEVDLRAFPEPFRQGILSNFWVTKSRRFPNFTVGTALHTK